MQLTPQEIAVNIEVKTRYFRAMRFIIADEDRYHLRSKLDFSNAIGWPQPNMYRAEKFPERGIPLRYVQAIVKMYNVDGNWLLTGEGEMFRPLKPPRAKKESK